LFGKMSKNVENITICSGFVFIEIEFVESVKFKLQKTELSAEGWFFLHPQVQQPAFCEFHASILFRSINHRVFYLILMINSKAQLVV
jgi:hypothetical protein